MGCVCSRDTGEERRTLSFSDLPAADRFGGIRKSACGSYDSGELRINPAKAGAGKVSETSSVLGRAGIAGLERAVEVLDTLGSSMSNLNPSSGFLSGIAARGNKVSILAFEVANTIAKGANLWRSLSDESIKFLKEDILQSDGVRKLISADINELLCIVAADKREELEVFSREVIRFGDLCKNPTWHNLGRYFQKLSPDLTPQEQLKAEVETSMQHLIHLAQNTSELYHELHALDRFEQDYRRKLQEEESLPAENLMILQSELKRQRKLVRSLKKKSLWSRNLEEVVEKFVDIVAILHKEILERFSNTATILADNGPAQNQRLGVSGLALHYANIINQIDNIASRPLVLPSSTRDSLYHGLPAGVKAALRSRLQAFDAKEEFTVAQIKAEMQKTLKWIFPLAENTIRAHQGFGWVGEWANIGTEVNKNPAPELNITRIQTLYHADKEKTDHYVLELVVWLHHLVIQVKNRGYGFKPLQPVRCQSQKETSLPHETKQDSSRACNTRAYDILQISEEERVLLDSLRSNRMMLGRSKSLELVTRKDKRCQRNRGLSRSSGHSPVKEFSLALDLQLERTRVLDVMDGIGTLGTFPTAPFYT
ncbi:protein PSK SIMULATOR 1-like isoform X2 [Phoenix dactylifera]|uniref:Protein PSK SIMULATOR 1-like isoform X2 n=1 Tax=Phoenix dactylifera TaxID=42345 RepID=A0A8B7BZN5_PHODC|nr:protein PSK SIMULATOR 1-like isoform X2 [Phoenix dactylifera]